MAACLQASKAGQQRELEKLSNEKSDLAARLEVLQNHIKTYQHQTRDLQ
jgi:peptidoglycan hydrolase CwlO-like protein